MKQQPIAPNKIIQILAVLLVLLALLAGYYHALYQTEMRKNDKLVQDELAIIENSNYE